MIADTQLLENIVSQAQQLSPEYRLRLIQRIAETLIGPVTSSQSQPIQFGKYQGDEAAMSTLEDFKIAEWWPAEPVIDGIK